MGRASYVAWPVFSSIDNAVHWFDYEVMKRTEYEAKVLEMLGDPKQVDQELTVFRKDARVLSSKQKHLLEQFPSRWIAIYHGAVAANARTLPALVEEMQKLGIPRGRAIVRFVNRNPRKMFL